MKGKGELFVVIGFAFKDGHGAIKLFGENKAGKHMREGHAGERELGVTAFVNLFGESVSTADEEDKAFGAAQHLLLHEAGELHRGHFRAMFIQQDNMIGRFDFLEKQLTFKLFLFLLAHLIFQIRDGFHFKRKIKLDFADVRGDCGSQLR